MHKHLILILKYVDVRILYVFAYLFIVPVCLLLARSRKTAYYFFRRRLKYGRCHSTWLTYVNHCRFAESVIDKFAMYAGRQFNVKVEGLDVFNKYAAAKQGFVMLSSHIGNYEIAGYTLASENKAIHAVVYAGEKVSVMVNRANMFLKNNIKMIPMRPDMSHLFEIDNALSVGDIVSFPTDRVNGASKIIERTFLGGTAYFPQGPFSVATMRSLNVLAVNVMKERWRNYRVFVTPLEYNRSLPRRQQITQLSEAYIRELELRIRQYPTQWYNFFEFWK